MPSADAKPFFASVIGELAERLEAPAFEPHVTLQGGKLDEQAAIALLERVAACTAPLRLQIAGIEYSEKFTKTLYVQFKASAEASAISAEFASGMGSDGGYEFDPHLSLLYKDMPERDKERLARELTFPFDNVSFDGVKLVSVPASIKTPEDVRAWRTLGERRLAAR